MALDRPGIFAETGLFEQVSIPVAAAAVSIMADDVVTDMYGLGSGRVDQTRSGITPRKHKITKIVITLLVDPGFAYQ